MKMRAIVSHGAGLEQLELLERGVARPGPGQVLLRMRAASVALRDYKMATGAYGTGEPRAARGLGGEGGGEADH